MEHYFEDGRLTIFLTGRLDTNSAPAVEQEINGLVEANAPAKVVMDCEKLEYIASAGLRVLLRVGKANDLMIINASRDIYDVLEMTGFTTMFETRKLPRSVSVDGCRVIGAGFSSNVYRINDDTIVKAFSKKVALDRIYSETASAKKTFIAGIPTAIPYDVVRVGDGYGTVFELIDADTLSQNFMDHPEHFDELMEKYTALLKNFHSTPAAGTTFPDIRDKFHTWAAGLKKYLTDEEVTLIDRMIDAVPDRRTMVHADCHSRNIMVQQGELIFIDMADVSVGHPLFDIGTEYFHYVIARETVLGAKLVFGVEPEDAELPLRVWNGLVRRYFAGFEGEELEEIQRMLKYFGCLRCLIIVAKHAHMDRETAMELVNRQRTDLFPHAEEAIALFSKADKYFI